MNRTRLLLIALCLALFGSIPANAQSVATYPPSSLNGQYGIFYTGPSREPEAVTQGHPLPVAVVSGGGSGSGVTVTNIASDSAGNSKVNVGSWTAGPITVESASSSMLQTGIHDQFIATVSTTVVTNFADLASAVPVPFWAIIRNTGAQKIHYNNGTPTDLHNYIGAGEEAGPFFFATNTPALQLKADAAGTGTMAIPIWR